MSFRLHSFTAFVVTGAIFVGAVVQADPKPPVATGLTPLEFSADMKPPGYLGTIEYQSTNREKPYLDRLSEDDRMTVESTDTRRQNSR
jgi:hypothetical protein